MNTVCGDNRFEIIAKVKEHLLKATNIEKQPEELKYADNILFRLWQLGYFDSVEKISKLEEQVEDLKSDHEYSLELMKGLNERIAELNRANEWHYVKDGDLPKIENLECLCIIRPINEEGESFKNEDFRGVLYYRNERFYLDEEEGCNDFSDVVIAWKEIVLPKE